MSPERTQPRSPEQTAAVSAPPDARIAGIANWLGHFLRTLKTCRLYDARNPNTIKFREDLGAQMTALLETHGAFKLEFAASEIHCDGHVVMAGRTREDNLAMPFYRDGLRTLTFTPDTEPRELEVVLDLVLRVTSRANNGSEDLITLLWDADMPHIDMSYMSPETDADLGDDDGELSLGIPLPHDGKLMPWPASGASSAGSGGTKGMSATFSRSNMTAGGAGASEGTADHAAGSQPAGGLDSDLQLRSDDWLAGEPAHELEELFRELDSNSAEDVDRFMSTLHQDRGVRLAPATMALVRESMRSGLLDGDRPDLVDLLVRVLYDSVGSANWTDARDAVDCLTECTEGQWDAATLIETLSRPESLVTTSLVNHLDGHPLAEVHEFVGFARSLGPSAIEWLMSIVAIANHQRTRRTLVRALSELCEGNPERLAPWLADPRWYVVRNAVMAVGSTEGGAPAGLFRPLLHHPEARVRQEVVAALANVDAGLARPLLLELVKDPESSIRSAALHRLGLHRDPQASAALIAIVLEPDFRKLPPDEVRSVTTALGGCAGDDVLPDLEEQLYPPGWFSKGAGPYSLSIARCIARIGTPAAMEVLEHASRSRIPATRDACRQVLKGVGHA